MLAASITPSRAPGSWFQSNGAPSFSRERSAAPAAWLSTSVPQDRATGVSLLNEKVRVSALVAVIGNDRRWIVGAVGIADGFATTMLARVA